MSLNCNDGIEQDAAQTQPLHNIHASTTRRHDFENDSCLFTCALFNGPVSSSDNFTSKDKMINNINLESCRCNHNLFFTISKCVGTLYLSKPLSSTVLLTCKEQRVPMAPFL